MMPIDYSQVAEFCANPQARLLEYRQFTSASEAFRFAVEDWPYGVLKAWIRTGGQEYAGPQILLAYHAAEYPLKRAVAHH